MPGPWVTTDDVLTELVDVAKVPVSVNPDHWAGIVASALAASTADITLALVTRGFDPGQIDQADPLFLRAVALDQAVYRSLLRGTGLHGFEKDQIESFDRRQELRDGATLVIGGKAVGPNPGGGSGGIAFGTSDAFAAESAEYDRLYGNRGGVRLGQGYF